MGGATAWDTRILYQSVLLAPAAPLPTQLPTTAPGKALEGDSSIWEAQMENLLPGFSLAQP